jgi:hypothetical protein
MPCRVGKSMVEGSIGQQVARSTRVSHHHVKASRGMPPLGRLHNVSWCWLLLLAKGQRVQALAASTCACSAGDWASGCIIGTARHEAPDGAVYEGSFMRDPDVPAGMLGELMHGFGKKVSSSLEHVALQLWLSQQAGCASQWPCMQNVTCMPAWLWS